MDAFIDGSLTLFSSPLSILIFFCGLIGGLLFGAIPGINMLTLGRIRIRAIAFAYKRANIVPIPVPRT